MEPDAGERSWFDPGTGIGIEANPPILFQDGEATVTFYRHYSSPCLLDADVIAQQAVCNSRKAQAQVPRNALKIAEECTILWDGELERISSIAKNKYPDSPRPIFHEPEFSSDFNSRSPRAISLLAVSTFVSILSSLTTTGVGLITAFNSIKGHQVYEQLEDYVKVQGQTNLLVAKGLKGSHESHRAYLDFVCNQELEENSYRLSTAAESVLGTYTKEVQRESLDFSFGDLPKSLDFLEALLRLCLETGTNQKSFCLQAIYEKKISFKYWLSCQNCIESAFTSFMGF